MKMTPQRMFLSVVVEPASHSILAEPSIPKHFIFDAYNVSRDILSRQKPKRKKTVRFGVVIVHEHPIIVGCNPAVSSGVPMTISWNRISTTETPLLEFEAIRIPERVSHRELLRQHPSERYLLLQNLGFSRHELNDAAQLADRTRELRELSYLDDENDIDDQLRKRLQKLYEVSRQRRQKHAKPVLSTMFRRIIGGHGSSSNTILHKESSKRRRSIAIASN